MPCSRSASSKRSRCGALRQQPLHLAPDGYQLRSRAHPIRAASSEPASNCAARPATRTMKNSSRLDRESKGTSPAPTTGWFHPRPPPHAALERQQAQLAVHVQRRIFQVHRRHSAVWRAAPDAAALACIFLAWRWLPHLLCGSTTFARNRGCLRYKLDHPYTDSPAHHACTPCFALFTCCNPGSRRTTV